VRLLLKTVKIPHKLSIFLGLTIFALGGLRSSYAIAAECLSETAMLNARIKILLLRYGGTEHGEALNQYTEFISLITRRITNLGPQIQERDRTEHTENAFTYLNDLEVEPQDTDPTKSRSGRHNYWENTESLELLRGTLRRRNSDYYTESDIYIGDLRGVYPRDEVTVTLPILDSEGPRILDFHSVVTLYALAMDASQLGCKYQAWIILESAFSILQDLKGPGQDLQGDLRKLEQAIQAEMTAREGTGSE
jgi:hypothetical protein